MLRRFSLASAAAPVPAPAASLIPLAVSCAATRGIVSGPGTGSFGGVHEQTVRGGLTGELKRGFRREVLENREKKVREEMAREKAEAEHLDVVSKAAAAGGVKYSADELRADATKAQRARQGAMFMENSDDPAYHVDKMYEAAGKQAPSVERDQTGKSVGGFHYDPETGESRQLGADEAKRMFHENEEAERLRAEDRELKRRRAEDRYRAFAKREPGKPLSGSTTEQRKAERELGNFFMDNPDLAVSRRKIYVSMGAMLTMFLGFCWCKDREGPLWDGAMYPEDEEAAKQLALLDGEAKEQRKISAAAVTFRQITGEEKRDSFAFHTASNAPPQKYDNIFFPEARKTRQ
jgi:hypothetical protein